MTVASSGRLRASASLTLAVTMSLASATPFDDNQIRGARGDDASTLGATPTFTKDVGPILFRNCARCHRAEGVAASVPLVAYEAVRRHAHTLRELVSRRLMPPWPADAAASLPFSNDPRLSQADIDTLVAWVDGGTPKGNDADLVELPRSGTGWLHPSGRPPDAVVTLPQYTVSANGTLPYIERLIKVPYREDRWISALQVRTSNPTLLHHMGVTEIALPAGVTPASMQSFDQIARQIGAPSGQLQIQAPAVNDAGNPGAYDMFAVYTPGTTFESYGKSNGKLLKGGDNYYLDFNIHYTTTGKTATDITRLGLWLEPNVPQRQLFRVPIAVKNIIVNGHQLLSDAPGTKAEGTDYALPPIGANTAHYEIIGVSAYLNAITIYQLQPHAHVRAKDFTYRAVYPDGTIVTMLTVPRYSYHFQLAYSLVTPLTLPAGSKIVVAAHYDNSLNNEHLRRLGTNDAARRCGPQNVVFFAQQNQSWDEMFSPLVQYAVAAKSGDDLPLIQTVGCLAKAPPKGWFLKQASNAVETREQGTSSTELAAASNIRAGHERFQLLGVDEFNPVHFAASRVAVKGVRIDGEEGPRINVTSLQAVAGSCQK